MKPSQPADFFFRRPLTIIVLQAIYFNMAEELFHLI